MLSAVLAGTRLGGVGPGALDLRVVRGLDSVCPFEPRPVLTIGNFDGVHRAHQQIIQDARADAVLAGAETVVLTFEPHPLSIVSPQKTPPRLMPLEEKLRCLEHAGADTVVVAQSEPKLLCLEAEVFVREIIQAKFFPRSIVEGASFGFGRGRRGDIAFLRRSCATFGCAIHVVEPVTFTRPGAESVLVSSSLIRRMLVDGDVETAAVCLGRSYALFGVVVEGDRRGRSLGFPTANLRIEEQLIPRDGVYAGWAAVRTGRFPAAVNIGPAPTFGQSGRRIEAHLLDFAGDLYGSDMQLELFAYLREQRTFVSAATLTEQLNLDVGSVRAAVAKKLPEASPSASS